MPPEPIPVTTPVVEPMVAALVLLLLHVPPVVASLKVMVEPEHKNPALEIASIGLTVTTVDILQPAVAVKSIVAVPPAIPVIMPEPDPMVAIEVLLLVHVPLPDKSVKVIVDPAQTGALPEIAAGCALTVTTVVVIHPESTLKVIVDVPAVTPVITPELIAVATAVLLLVHEIGFEVTSVNWVVDPAHTVPVPVMADGLAITATG